MNINSNNLGTYATLLGNSAHNVANVNTKNFSSINSTESGKVVQSRGGSIDIANELVGQISLTAALSSEVKAINTQNEMIKSLLDIKA
jgi:hypothetical protein